MKLHQPGLDYVQFQRNDIQIYEKEKIGDWYFTALSFPKDLKFESIHLDNPDLLRNSTLPNLDVSWFDVSENEESVRNLIIVEGTTDV